MSEFFRKLKAKHPEYYEIVSKNQAELEQLIKEELQHEAGGKISWVTYWGESRYACGDVIEELGDKEYIEVLGEYKLEEEEETHLYSLWFIPTEESLFSEVQIIYYR